VRDPEPFVDIHCHLVPAIDDGAQDWEETLTMARMAVADGFETIVVTPHQLGSFAANDGATIRRRTVELQGFLDDQHVPLNVLPGGDVRIEPDLADQISRGAVLTLADRGRHVLLELPHEIYVPLEPILEQLQQIGVVGILSHPERNHGILAQPKVVEKLVDQGCLMQVTAGSLIGAFGPDVQRLSDSLLDRGLIHFLATDAHGSRLRRPLMRGAFQRTLERTDWETACQICCRNPALVAAGKDVLPGRLNHARPSGLRRLFGFRRAA
jgi:protein-tyrosine phosphatase